MSLILARSPFFVSRGDLDSGAILTLEIGDYDNVDNVFEIKATLTLNFRDNYLLDISALISDYIESEYYWASGSQGYVKEDSYRIRYARTTLSGNINGVAQSNVIDEYYVSNGYLYSEDEYNKDFSTVLRDNAYYAGSTDIIYKLDDSNIRIPLLNTMIDIISSSTFGVGDVYLNFYNKEELKGVVTTVFEYLDSSRSFKNISSNDSFKERVDVDSGIYEDSNCLQKFFRKYKLEDYDKLVITTDDGYQKTIDIVSISECKNKPYRLTFLNRYGIDEDIWFFKKSTKSISRTSESFKSNEIGAYYANDTIKSYREYNVNAKESLMLNSGFVDEKMNEAFKQLMLSEEVVLYDFNNNTTHAINIKTGELQYKTHVNDKLINYTIEVEFANDVINNIG